MAHMVMVVDDSALIRMKVRRALIEAGFEVIEARDGVEAWDKIRNGPKLSLVVLDVNMPSMNGLELLELLGENRRDDTPEVLMLTTEGQPDLIQRARQLGAKGWIVKPFRSDLLAAAARKITAARQAGGSR